jgi:K+-sensing histidine kinase KdpD
MRRESLTFDCPGLISADPGAHARGRRHQSHRERHATRAREHHAVSLGATATDAPRRLDTGRGVTAEDIPRLFERFFRSDRARASRGTGLGLAIVKHVVTAAGGEVEARNCEGGGLEIQCTFPGPQ